MLDERPAGSESALAEIAPDAVVTDLGDDEAPQAPESSPAAPAPAAQPAATTPAQPSEPAAPTPPSTPPTAGAPAAPSATPPTDWTFTGDGNEIAVEGSRVQPNGDLLIPQNQLEALAAILAEGIAHRGSWRQTLAERDQQIAQMRAQANVPSQDVLRAQAYNRQLLALMEKGPDAVAAWLDNYQQNFPLFHAKAESALLQAQLAQRDQRLAAFAEQDAVAEIAPRVENLIAEAIGEQMKAYPSVDARGLWNRIVNRYWDQVAYEVTAQDRPQGLRQGEMVVGQLGQTYYIVNVGLIGEEFAYQASLLQGSANAAAQAVQQNRAAAAPAVAATAPPAAGGAVVPQGGPVKVPTTREEFEKWMESGDWRRTVFPGSNQ